MTCSSYNDVRYRLLQNFKQKIALQLNNEDDYYNIFDDIRKKRPSHLFGRGLVRLEDGGIYEFQTAKICEPEKWNVYIREKIDELNETDQIPAKPIPVIPDKVTFDAVKDSLKGIESVPLGITKKDLKTYTYDFKKNLVNIITAKNLDDAAQYVSHILEELKQIKGLDITILDFERVFFNKKSDVLDNYNKFITEMSEGKSKNQKVCIILGIDKMLSDLEEGESELLQIIQKAENLETYNFIIVESATRLKNHEYDEWYKEYIPGDTGIWVGNGVDDQYLITVNSIGRTLINNCRSRFWLCNKARRVNND